MHIIFGNLKFVSYICRFKKKSGIPGFGCYYLGDVGQCLAPALTIEPAKRKSGQKYATKYDNDTTFGYL